MNWEKLQLNLDMEITIVVYDKERAICDAVINRKS